MVSGRLENKAGSCFIFVDAAGMGDGFCQLRRCRTFAHPGRTTDNSQVGVGSARSGGIQNRFNGGFGIGPGFGVSST